MAQRRHRKPRWPEGTWMRLISGDRLRKAIERKGLTYQEFADQVPCSKSMVGHLCTETRRSCTPQLAEAIARRLDADIDYFFVPSVPLDKGQLTKQHTRKVAA